MKYFRILFDILQPTMALQAFYERDFDTFASSLTLAASWIDLDTLGIEAIEIMDEDPRFVEYLIDRGLYFHHSRLLKNRRLLDRYWQRLVSASETSNRLGSIEMVEQCLFVNASDETVREYLERYGLQGDGEDTQYFTILEEAENTNRILLLAQYEVFTRFFRGEEVAFVYTTNDLYQAYRHILSPYMRVLQTYANRGNQDAVENLENLRDAFEAEENIDAIAALNYARDHPATDLESQEEGHE